MVRFIISVGIGDRKAGDLPLEVLGTLRSLRATVQTITNMLDRPILLIGILGAWIVSGAVTAVLRRKRGHRLPPGSIVLERPESGVVRRAPGMTWSKFGVTLAMGGNIVFVLAVIGGLLFDPLKNTLSYVTWDLPSFINVIGLVGIWCHLAMGVGVIYYNVNYTPLYKPMPETYVLATGGPYRLVRHPMYLSYLGETLFIFLTTGIWLIAVTAIGWVSLPRQVREEEKELGKLFGETYGQYAAATGKLLPRFSASRRQQ